MLFIFFSIFFLLNFFYIFKVYPLGNFLRLHPVFKGLQNRSKLAGEGKQIDSNFSFPRLFFASFLTFSLLTEGRTNTRFLWEKRGCFFVPCFLVHYAPFFFLFPFFPPRLCCSLSLRERAATPCLFRFL